MKKDLTLGALTGILLALSFPPFKTGFLAYGALIPFFLLLEDKKGGQAFRWGYITGFLIDLGTLFWIGWVTLPGCIGALLVLPLFFGLYALLHTFIVQRLSDGGYLAVPFLWTAVEYLLSLGETAFPWNYLGYTQSYYRLLIQYAEITSIYGVSFWVVLVNVLLYFIWRQIIQRRLEKRTVLALPVLFLLPVIYGFLAMHTLQATQEKLKVALLQGNVDPFEKWESDSKERNYALYEAMTRLAAEDSPDLFVWPETAMPFYLRSDPEIVDNIHSLTDSMAVPVLTGGLDFDYPADGEYRYYNAAFLFEPNSKRIQHYWKSRLVPFSERVPYKDFFPFNALKSLLYDMKLGIGDYSRGTLADLFEFSTYRVDRHDVKKYRFAVAICYESVFPDIIRKFAREGIDFLAIITNDAWFGKTSAPFQHAQIAVFRAIENRIPIVRCANTGVSCFIDPSGRVYSQTPIFKQKIAIDEITLYGKKTYYARHGNIFAQMACIIAILSVIVALVKTVLK
jgi:apolipoprotein N-acyltransferase